MPKSILKSNEEIAMILMLKPARKPAGKAVQAAVLARVEAEIELQKQGWFTLTAV